MFICSLVSLSRCLRQIMYWLSKSRFVSLFILRAILVSLMPVSRAICRKLLPFSRYIVIRTLSLPFRRFSLPRSRSISSRYWFLASSVFFEIFLWIFFIYYFANSLRRPKLTVCRARIRALRDYIRPIRPASSVLPFFLRFSARLNSLMSKQNDRCSRVSNSTLLFRYIPNTKLILIIYITLSSVL